MGHRPVLSTGLGSVHIRPTFVIAAPLARLPLLLLSEARAPRQYAHTALCLNSRCGKAAPARLLWTWDTY